MASKLSYDERARLYTLACGDLEAQHALQKAREFRASRDYVAAGDLEKHAASCIRYRLRILTKEAELEAATREKGK